MAINFRGPIQFLFNMGRGIRTNQIDGWDALDAQVKNNTAKTHDITVGTSHSGFANVNSDGSEGGVAVRRGGWTLAQARAATFAVSVDTTTLAQNDDASVLVQVPHGADPALYHSLLTSTNADTYNAPVSGYELLGGDTDSNPTWDFYFQRSQTLGALVASVTLQVAGTVSDMPSLWRGRILLEQLLNSIQPTRTEADRTKVLAVDPNNQNSAVLADAGITQTAADARYVRDSDYTTDEAAIQARLRGELIGFNADTTFGGDGDWGKILQFFGATARTLTLPNMDSGWQGHRFFVNNNASATLTITPHSSDQINLGGAGNSVELLAGEFAMVFAANPAAAGNWTLRKIDLGGVQFSAIDKAKLDSIELGATVDQSGPDIVGLLEALTGNARLQASAIRDLPDGGGPYSLQRTDYVDTGTERDIFDSATQTVNEALYGTIYAVDIGSTFTFDIDPDGNYGYAGGTLAFYTLSGSTTVVQVEGRTLVTVPAGQFVQIIYEPDGAGEWLVTTQTPFADIQSSLAHKIEHLEEITRGLSVEVVDETWARAGNALTAAGVYVSATPLNLTQVRALADNVWQTRIDLSNQSGYVYLRLPHAAVNASGRFAFTHRNGSITTNLASSLWNIGNTEDGSTAKFFGFYASRGQREIISPDITRVEAQVGTGLEEAVFRGGLGVSAWPDTSGAIVTLTEAQNTARIAANTVTIAGKLYVVTG